MVTTTPSSSLNTFLGPNPGLERLYDNVQAIVPSVSIELVKMMSWNTIEDFYIQSTARRENVYWSMAIGTSQVDFNPFDASWLVAWILDVSGLSSFQVSMPGLLIDLNDPTGPRSGQALLALKPVDFSADFPVELFTQWFETILAGVLFRLYSLPAKPYSAPQLAMYQGKLYRGGVARARGIAQKQFTNGGGRWNFPQFAGGRRKN